MKAKPVAYFLKDAALYKAFLSLDTQYQGKGQRRSWTRNVGNCALSSGDAERAQSGADMAHYGAGMTPPIKLTRSSTAVAQVLKTSSRTVERMRTIRTYADKTIEQALISGQIGIQEAYKCSLLLRDAKEIARGTKPLAGEGLASVLRSFMAMPRGSMDNPRSWNAQEAQLMRDLVRYLIKAGLIEAREEYSLETGIILSQTPIFGGALNVRNGGSYV